MTQLVILSGYILYIMGGIAISIFNTLIHENKKKQKGKKLKKGMPVPCLLRFGTAWRILPYIQNSFCFGFYLFCSCFGFYCCTTSHVSCSESYQNPLIYCTAHYGYIWIIKLLKEIALFEQYVKKQC